VSSAWTPGPRRKGRLLIWVAVACVAAIVVEAGAVTNGFGLLRARSGTSGGGNNTTGPDPNPFHEKVTAVVGGLTYSGGGTNPFPALAGGELCSKCPELPKENSSYSPPVAGLWFFFNVTVTGHNASHLGNFSLTTSGSNPSLFKLVGVLCCYTTKSVRYAEQVLSIYVIPGNPPIGLAVYVIASLVPSDGGVGYALTLHMTSP